MDDQGGGAGGHEDAELRGHTLSAADSAHTSHKQQHDAAGDGGAPSGYEYEGGAGGEEEGGEWVEGEVGSGEVGEGGAGGAFWGEEAEEGGDAGYPAQDAAAGHAGQFLDLLLGQPEEDE